MFRPGHPWRNGVPLGSPGPAIHGRALGIAASATGTRGNAKKYSIELLEKEAVAATPGLDFGRNATGRYVRFAYTRSMADLEEAAVRITRFAS